MYHYNITRNVLSNFNLHEATQMHDTQIAVKCKHPRWRLSNHKY